MNFTFYSHISILHFLSYVPATYVALFQRPTTNKPICDSLQTKRRALILVQTVRKVCQQTKPVGRVKYPYSKTCIKRPLSKRPKIGFQDQLSLNVGQNIAECSKGIH